MAQGKDFCLESTSRAERITEDRKKRNQYRDHRQEAYRCITLTAIASARTEFLVGTIRATSSRAEDKGKSLLFPWEGNLVQQERTLQSFPIEESQRTNDLVMG